MEEVVMLREQVIYLLVRTPMQKVDTIKHLAPAHMLKDIIQ